MTTDAQQIAERCAEIMLSQDDASRGLGMELVSVSPGKSVMTMPVRQDMVNGHGICHGGYIFTFADSAFAFACNTYDEVTVAASAEISFLAPVHAGEKLTATATETYRRGRNGIYDIIVTRKDGETVAAFRGKSRSLRQKIISGDNNTGA